MAEYDFRPDEATDVKCYALEAIAAVRKAFDVCANSQDEVIDHLGKECIDIQDALLRVAHKALERYDESKEGEEAAND